MTAIMETETYMEPDALACTRMVSRLGNAAKLLDEQGNDQTARALAKLASYMDPRRPITGMADVARALLGEPLAVDPADESDQTSVYLRSEPGLWTVTEKPVRLCVDADCPSCGWGERWYDVGSKLFGCPKCDHTSTAREGDQDAVDPADEESDGWRPMADAPHDGTVIEGWFGDGEIIPMQWAEQRVCMLASTAPGAGLFRPGWQDAANQSVLVDEPMQWRDVSESQAVTR